MLWKNKGHEFDQLVDRNFLKKRIFIFGAGRLGRQHYNTVNRFGNLFGFLDNDSNKWGELYLGLPVVSLADYMQKYNDEETIVVLCVKEAFSQQIVKQLSKAGLRENQYLSYARYERMLRIALMYERNLLYLPLAQISLTERCTLKCKKCAHACNLVPMDREDMAFEEAKSSMDWFFKYVDYIDEFVLIGGEPLIYKHLKDIAEYIGVKYRKQINIFSITTNATVMPSDELLEICHKHDMLFRISNYQDSLPVMEEKVSKLVNRLGNYSVPCTIVRGGWTDYGFDYVDREANTTELIKVFDECHTTCHEIRDRRFYFCVMARSVSENMNRGIGTDDYFDLSSIENVKVENNKMSFFEYTMGYSTKGYLDMCNHCHGADRINWPILAAEQM